MKKPSSIPRLAAKIIICLFLSATHLPGVALSTDKDQPIEVEANEADLDDLNNVSIYRGNVIVTQGSIYMTGDVMTVHNTEDGGLDYLIMEGNPATYKQLPDNSSIHDQAKALRMEYYELKNLVVLIRDAWVKQKTATLVGERIEYNTELSRVKAWSEPTGETTETTAQPKKKGRVKLIIKKKKDTDS